jgi:hypothetical protein
LDERRELRAAVGLVVFGVAYLLVVVGLASVGVLLSTPLFLLIVAGFVPIFAGEVIYLYAHRARVMHNLKFETRPVQMTRKTRVAVLGASVLIIGSLTAIEADAGPNPDAAHLAALMVVAIIAVVFHIGYYRWKARKVTSNQAK